eukprot:Gregarina_sp_Poly_1__4270@NODE_2324_length_2296_cov_134_233737_g1488_i0_p1_GENE_NODE_2324_length_2296_cov_134_233737_g1488_i0NODE_2324_length_2296_cov_134_233737_g1488_i0_p1_ORF_typecomplete_len394_score50_47AAR2/PF05282_11/1_1e48EndonucMspI/PF09208_10/0_26_NODE_2324_length_2296_cov_134_233737_g1488_i011152161
MSAMLPGAHFIYWKRDGKGDYLQSGEFCYLSQREVIVYRWANHCFLRVLDADEVARFQMGHENLTLLSHAAAYPQEYTAPWSDVVYAISRVAICLFQGSDLLSQQEDTLEEYRDTAEATFDERPGQSLGDRPYSDIPNKLKLKARSSLEFCVPSAVSATNMDRSSDLEQLLEHYAEVWEGAKTFSSFETNELNALSRQLDLTNAECLLLGELQISYVSFLLGSSLQSQIQWKDMLILLGNSECLAESRAALGSEMLRLLYGQISQMPEDFVLSEISKSNFIIWTLMSLSEIFKDSESSKIRRRLKLLEVSAEFGHDLNSLGNGDKKVQDVHHRALGFARRWPASCRYS